MKKILLLISITLFVSLALVGVVSAASTIGTNITTGGTLDVTGASTLTGATTIAGLLTTNGDVTMSEGATLVNTDASTLTVTEATTAFVGAITVSGDITLGDAVTDTITINSPITSNPTFATGQTVYYLRSTDTALTGDHNNVRARGQAAAVSETASDVRGLYAQGVVNENTYGNAITSIYANTILKTGSSATTARGILIDTETEGTPTLITNMYGLYVRNKSTVAVGGDNMSIVIDNEKMGSGIVQDAGIQLKTTTWADAQTAYTYGIDMNMTGDIGTADMRLSHGDTIKNSAASSTLITGLIVETSAEDLGNGADGGASCAAGNKGSIMIDSNNQFFGCDGTNWQAFGTDS